MAQADVEAVEDIDSQAGEQLAREPAVTVVMQDHIDALVKRADFTRYFTEDVIATFEGTDRRADGREAAGQLIRYVHETAFDARPELKNLLADTGKAAIEADFAGTHTGEFAGIAPTGREVRVPYSVIYDLRGDQISALRYCFGRRPESARSHPHEITRDEQSLLAASQLAWCESVCVAHPRLPAVSSGSAEAAVPDVR